MDYRKVKSHLYVNFIRFSPNINKINYWSHVGTIIYGIVV